MCASGELELIATAATQRLQAMSAGDVVRNRNCSDE